MADIHLLFWLSLFPFATAYLGATRGAAFATTVDALLAATVAFACVLLPRNLTRLNADVTTVTPLARRRQPKNIPALFAMLVEPAAACFISDRDPVTEGLSA